MNPHNENESTVKLRGEKLKQIFEALNKEKKKLDRIRSSRNFTYEEGKSFDDLCVRLQSFYEKCSVFIKARKNSPGTFMVDAYVNWCLKMQKPMEKSSESKETPVETSTNSGVETQMSPNDTRYINKNLGSAISFPKSNMSDEFINKSNINKPPFSGNVSYPGYMPPQFQQQFPPGGFQPPNYPRSPLNIPPPYASPQQMNRGIPFHHKMMPNMANHVQRSPTNYPRNPLPYFQGVDSNANTSPYFSPPPRCIKFDGPGYKPYPPNPGYAYNNNDVAILRTPQNSVENRSCNFDPRMQPQQMQQQQMQQQQMQSQQMQQQQMQQQQMQSQQMQKRMPQYILNNNNISTENKLSLDDIVPIGASEEETNSKEKTPNTRQASADHQTFAQARSLFGTPLVYTYNKEQPNQAINRTPMMNIKHSPEQMVDVKIKNSFPDSRMVERYDQGYNTNRSVLRMDSFAPGNVPDHKLMNNAVHKPAFVNEYKAVQRAPMQPPFVVPRSIEKIKSGPCQVIKAMRRNVSNLPQMDNTNEKAPNERSTAIQQNNTSIDNGIQLNRHPNTQRGSKARHTTFYVAESGKSPFGFKIDLSAFAKIKPSIELGFLNRSKVQGHEKKENDDASNAFYCQMDAIMHRTLFVACMLAGSRETKTLKSNDIEVAFKKVMDHQSNEHKK